MYPVQYSCLFWALSFRMDSIAQLTPHTKLHLAESINKSERPLRSSPQPLNKQLTKLQALSLCILHISAWRLQRIFGWSLPSLDPEAEDAEGRRVALVLIPEFWTCHPFSCSPRTAADLFSTSSTAQPDRAGAGGSCRPAAQRWAGLCTKIWAEVPHS